MINVVLLENMIKDFADDKAMYYKLLRKFIKSEPLNPDEFNTIKFFLIKVINIVTEQISEPFKNSVKFFIATILTNFIKG